MLRRAMLFHTGQFIGAAALGTPRRRAQAWVAGEAGVMPSAETVCLHVFENARWLNEWRPRFGLPRFDFIPGRATRDVTGILDLHPRYRVHLLVGTGGLLAAYARNIISLLPSVLGMNDKLVDNTPLLRHVFGDFFGRFPNLPGFVFPMQVHPSSRYTAASVGIRVNDEGVASNDDVRTDAEIHGGTKSFHSLRFGLLSCDRPRDVLIDLRTARFAIPSSRRDEQFSLSSLLC